MKPVIIILRSGISGGTGTLSIRIGEWLVDSGYEVIYVCQTINDINNAESMKEKGIIVFRWEINEIAKNIINAYDGCQFIFLTYSLDEFLFVETLKKKLVIQKNILYVVHTFGLVKGVNYNSKIRKIIKFFYSNVIKRLIYNKSIIFMDNLCIEETEKYYDIRINKNDNIVFNLPIKVEEIDPIKIANKTKQNTFSILTIMRAELPFKGYIIGLIDDFRILSDIYENLTLTIVTFGADINAVYVKINELPDKIKCKISIYGKTPYEMLEEYFNQANIFIGMGTTLLDAVNHGVPSIVVQSYTYNSNSSGFFHNQPEMLVAYEDKLVPTIELIKQVIQMSEYEYIDLCKIEYEALENYYNIDKFANNLVDKKKYNKKRIISRYQLKINALLIKINEMIKK